MTKAAELAKMGEVLTNSQIGGRRNIIINGAMQVAQRSTSATGLGGSSGYFGLDRFQIFFNTSGRLTMSQEADGPSGFANSMKLACTTADTSIAATENIILSQAIEAQNLQQLKKGTSDAEKFTLSFYVKGNASAAYSVEIYDSDNNRQIGQTFSVTTSWNRVVLTFDADTSGALNDDNGVGFYVNWWLHAGSNYTGGTFSTTWTDYANNQRAGNTTSFVDSTSRTFFMTGVQLEVGSQATPFEHRSFGEELDLCQRYFERFQGADGSRGVSAYVIGGGIWYSADQVLANFQYKTKRASPDISVSAADALKAYTNGAAKAANDSTCFDQIEEKNARINISPFTGSGTAGYGTLVQLNSDDYIDVSAEL